MNHELDKLKIIINDIKQYLEVISGVINLNNENVKETNIIINNKNNYFYKLITDINELGTYSNVSFDQKNNQMSLSLSILKMHLSKLLYNDNKIKTINANDIDLVKNCISEISKITIDLDNYYTDDTKEKFFSSLANVYKSFKSIDMSLFLRDTKTTEQIVNQIISLINRYESIYAKMPSNKILNLSEEDYEKFDATIYASIHLYKFFIDETFKKIIAFNDKSPVLKGGILPENYKSNFLNFIKQEKYQNLLEVKMLDKEIIDNSTIKELLYYYNRCLLSTYNVINYESYNNFSKNNRDYILKSYDFDLFDDDIKKNINYIVKYSNLKNKYKNGNVSKNELQLLKLLEEKMNLIVRKMRNLLFNLHIMKMKKHVKINKSNKYSGKNIIQNKGIKK